MTSGDDCLMRKTRCCSPTSRPMASANPSRLTTSSSGGWALLRPFEAPQGLLAAASPLHRSPQAADSGQQSGLGSSTLVPFRGWLNTTNGAKMASRQEVLATCNSLTISQGAAGALDIRVTDSHSSQALPTLSF